jgi:hypothetical protein
MVVMARDEWTDGRIDEFKENVNQRFDWVDKRFDKVEADMKAGFDRVDKDIREIRGEISQIHVTLAGMQRTMTQGFIGICGLMVAGFGTLVGLQVF